MNISNIQSVMIRVLLKALPDNVYVNDAYYDLEIICDQLSILQQGTYVFYKYDNNRGVNYNPIIAIYPIDNTIILKITNR